MDVQAMNREERAEAVAEEAIEEPGFPAVIRFVLVFYPSWSIWEEARKYANLSGTDDVSNMLDRGMGSA